MTSPPFEVVRRAPSVRLAGMITGMTGYRELVPGDWRQHEAASLVVPLIINLGSPFLIALDREPGESDGQPSFAAGLHAGPVRIRSDGRAECLQVDFSPLGAFRFFGGAVADLSSRMIDITDVLGADGLNLRDRLGDLADWERRFDLVEEFLLARDGHRPTAELAHAYGRLARSAGSERVAALAESVGWSRKHLTARFRAELGVGPKTIARVMRFERACRLARAGGCWAAVAADSGYADQAHLTREFAALAGESPGTWARRAAGRRAASERFVGPARRGDKASRSASATPLDGRTSNGRTTMTDATLDQAPRLYPTLRCRDADAMIAWLTGVLGFAERVTYRDDAGVVHHAELAFGPSILMLGQERDDAYGAHVGGAAGRRTDSLYVAVDDPDALHARVAASGATIETPLHDTDYGSRDFACRDTEGNLWSFGTYRPSADQPGPG